MKKIYTLFIVSLFAITVIGQSDKTKTRDYQSLIKQHLFQNKENLKDIRPESYMFKKYDQAQQKPNSLNSSRDTKQGLDSIVSEYYNISEEHWVNDSKNTFMYDARGNNTQGISIEWDTESDSWVNERKSEYSYNSKGNLIQEKTYNWTGNPGQWEEISMNEYKYDANGKVIQDIVYTWEDNEWIKWYKVDITYDANGKLTELITSAWYEENNEWFEAYRETYDYDADENMTLETWHEWDFESNDWAAYWKQENSFDSDGNIILGIVYKWNSSENKWAEDYKSEYTNNNEGSMTQNITYLWGQENEWINLGKYNYTHDSSGNMTSEITFSWNSNANQWKQNFKDDYIFNNDYTRKDLLLPVAWLNDFINQFYYHLYYDYFKHMLTDIKGYYWDENTSQFVFTRNKMMYYSEHEVTDISTNSLEGINIYPNPASDFIYFELTDNSTNSTVKIFDVQGRKILNQEISGKQQISVSHLDKGLYIYTLNQNGKTQSGKIMIK